MQIRCLPPVQKQDFDRRNRRVVLCQAPARQRERGAQWPGSRRCEHEQQ